ncbi:MAG: Rieske 2Fe-2S domain-containing protein [Rhodospirillaceae bacterium]|nr:Rieske 2Fe-2S domain-containing protein [Rhodospirillaceae bacterium]
MPVSSDSSSQSGASPAIGAAEIAALVEPDRVHRRAYTDRAVFDLEMARIFGRAWIFVAHTSQIPGPNDLIRTRLGLHDVLATRDGDGRVHVVGNRCTHRGTTLCSVERANAASLVCPYHAWTFALDGTLRSVPHRKSMPDSFDIADPRLALFRAPRVADYRGFVFASLAADGPGLEDFLGDMTEALDNLVDRAPDGEIFQDGGIFRLEYRGNWKLHHENANDTMHPGFVHESSVNAAREDGRDYAEPVYDEHQAHTQLLSNGFSVREWQSLGLQGLANGHSYMDGFYSEGVLSPDRDDPLSREYRAALEAAKGRAAADAILGMDRFNNLIWPNLNINAQYQQIRIVQPVAPDRTVVQAMCFRLGGAPEGMFHRAVRFLTNLSSPASMIFADDVEIFEKVQAGLADGSREWLDQSRGLDAPVDAGAGGGGAGNGRLASPGTSELPIRGQFRAWLDHMTA